MAAAAALKQLVSNINNKRGDWIIFPFMAGTVTSLTLAGGGWGAHLMVYLIQEFNISGISSALISNVVNGFINLFPVLGAIIVDSILGSFHVIWMASFISSLVIFMMHVFNDSNFHASA